MLKIYSGSGGGVFVILLKKVSEVEKHYNINFVLVGLKWGCTKTRPPEYNMELEGGLGQEVAEPV